MPQRSPLSLLLALTLVVACEPNRSPTPEPPRDDSAAPASAEDAQLKALLRAPDRVIDEQALAAIAPPEAILAAFARMLAEPETSLYERTRIVSALRLLEAEGAEALLEGVLRDPETTVFVRRVAIKAYGQRAGARALPLITTFAEDADRHTREAVIRSLAAIDTAPARDLLRKRAAEEDEADLRALADRFLERR